MPGRIVRLQGMPDFNAADPAFKIFQFDGFMSTPAPDAVWVSNGGGVGAVASGPWLAKERACLCVGRIKGDQAALALHRRALLAALPTGRDVPVQFLGSGWDVDLQMFVRRYDVADISLGLWLDFSIPLIATDPLKYGLTPLAGTCGVWTGESWYYAMTWDGTNWHASMPTDGANRYLALQQDVPDGPYPTSLTLTSAGDVSSRRVVAEVTGPLTAGDWFLWSETSGARSWVEVGVGAGQTLIMDSASRTATLNGADATHLTYGDWLSLEPGANTYRLVAGADSDAFCTITALEAYE